ncbi:MnmC family methyltransferase [Methanobrevibacter sp. DSM 116169]|uniref:MnmC family methyltransferase n=1 Tax=Methanobrevibacter sp. DSM 116169 TaxID=3242727 RepID=UPI0038FCCE0C
MSYKEESRVINENIFDLVNQLAKKERETQDKTYRNNFFNENKDYFVLTEDNSYSIKSKEINNKIETLHTKTGAISESFEKFIKPLKLDYSNDIAILDICGGLGYNSSAAIANFQENSNKNLKIDLIEISKSTLACGLFTPSPIEAHNITKKTIENELINQNYLTLNLEPTKIPENIDFNIFTDDARKTVQNLKDTTYDAIFLDPFSQNMSPELFSTDFFKHLRRIIKDNGIVATYTSSAPVRNAFIEANFHIGQGPIFGRKQGGTIASPNPEMLNLSLPKNDEIRIALSDVSTTFKDPNLNFSSNEILINRANEREKVRHNTKISSAVKSPIFLTKDLKEDEKLKRRVERNLIKMNIPSTTSKEAFYILEPENTYQNTQNRTNNSRLRILEMEKRLNKVKNKEIIL